MNTKKCIILLAAVLLGSANAFAQSKWVIRFNDDSEKEFNIENIKEMFPYEVTPIPITPSETSWIVFNVSDNTPQTRSADAGMHSKLNNHFVVEGVKYKDNMQTVVFDNYYVRYIDDSEPNVWEYVGPGLYQPIKYWDYSSEKYNFIAYSTGNAVAVYNEAVTLDGGQVFVSPIDASKMNGVVDDNGKIKDGAFIIRGKLEDVAEVYVADAKTVYKGNGYGKEVELSFQTLSTKVRTAFYETIPGYSVKDLKFYENDETVAGVEARLYTDNTDIFCEQGKYIVYYPTTGIANTGLADYNKPHVAFLPDTNSSSATYKVFGALNYYAIPEHYEANGNYLGRSSNTATYAGNPSDNYFMNVNSNEAGATLNIKVDYTLVGTDGSGETIIIKGATAQVPAQYASWKPGYSYTYLFKVCDRYSSQPGQTPAEMFPIVFAGVVIEEIRSSNTTYYEW